MAQKVKIELIDDIDGNAADETVVFGLDGATYEIDLNKKNAKDIRKVLAPYVDGARKVRGSKRTVTKSTTGASDSKRIRDWAVANGVEVPARGRIPAAVRDQYAAAN